MARRLRDIERDVLEEQAQAKEFMRKGRKSLPPVDDPDLRGRVMGADGRLHRREVALPEEAVEWHIVHSERNKLVPLQGTSPPIDIAYLVSAGVSARVNHVLSFLTKEQRELLRGYYIEGLDRQELGFKKSRQAFHERLAWARKAFERAWLEHAADDVYIGEEDL